MLLQQGMRNAPDDISSCAILVVCSRTLSSKGDFRHNNDTTSAKGVLKQVLTIVLRGLVVTSPLTAGGHKQTGVNGMTSHGVQMAQLGVFKGDLFLWEVVLLSRGSFHAKPTANATLCYDIMVRKCNSGYMAHAMTVSNLLPILIVLLSFVVPVTRFIMHFIM